MIINEFHTPVLASTYLTIFRRVLWIRFRLFNYLLVNKINCVFFKYSQSI